MKQCNPSIRFFPRTCEANVWDTHAQGWTGRVSALQIFNDDRLMATLGPSERLRIARMAAPYSKLAAYWWAQHATRKADRLASRKYQ